MFSGSGYVGVVQSFGEGDEKSFDVYLGANSSGDSVFLSDKLEEMEGKAVFIALHEICGKETKGILKHRIEKGEF